MNKFNLNHGMSNNSKCFVLHQHGVYEEITYAELKKRRTIDSRYDKKRFIQLHGMLLEVSEQSYSEYYKYERRRRYIEEESKRNGEIHYDDISSDNENGESLIIDTSTAVEDIVITKIMKEQLSRLLSQLSKDDQYLIQALYFDNKGARELAKELGVTHPTIIYRRNKILAKLKKEIG
jgi:RNA polymerase sigma factor (sigma-70 family)